MSIIIKFKKTLIMDIFERNTKVIDKRVREGSFLRFCIVLEGCFWKIMKYEIDVSE